MNHCTKCDTELPNSNGSFCEDCKPDIESAIESATDEIQADLDKQDDMHTDGSGQAERPATLDAWRVESIREEWTALNVRLPDHLMRRFDAEQKRLDYALAKEGNPREMGKDRHYKPLIIALGLRFAQQLDTDELTNLLADLERNQIVD